MPKPTDIIVSGAGDPSVNGTYVWKGTANGRRKYQKDSNTLQNYPAQTVSAVRVAGAGQPYDGVYIPDTKVAADSDGRVRYTHSQPTGGYNPKIMFAPTSLTGRTSEPYVVSGAPIAAINGSYYSEPGQLIGPDDIAPIGRSLANENGLYRIQYLPATITNVPTEKILFSNTVGIINAPGTGYIEEWWPSVRLGMGDNYVVGNSGLDPKVGCTGMQNKGTKNGKPYYESWDAGPGFKIPHGFGVPPTEPYELAHDLTKWLTLWYDSNVSRWTWSYWSPFYTSDTGVESWVRLWQSGVTTAETPVGLSFQWVNMNNYGAVNNVFNGQDVASLNSSSPTFLGLTAPPSLEYELTTIPAGFYFIKVGSPWADTEQYVNPAAYLGADYQVRGGIDRRADNRNNKTLSFTTLGNEARPFSVIPQFSTLRGVMGLAGGIRSTAQGQTENPYLNFKIARTEIIYPQRWKLGTDYENYSGSKTPVSTSWIPVTESTVGGVAGASPTVVDASYTLPSYWGIKGKTYYSEQSSTQASLGPENDLPSLGLPWTSNVAVGAASVPPTLVVEYQPFKPNPADWIAGWTTSGTAAPGGTQVQFPIASLPKLSATEAQANSNGDVRRCWFALVDKMHDTYAQKVQQGAAPKRMVIRKTLVRTTDDQTTYTYVFSFETRPGDDEDVVPE